MENAKISNLYDLDETIAKEYLEQFTYPWEALKGISEFIKKLGPTLDPEKFEKRGEDIWVAKSAKVAPTACLNGPLIIDEDAEIRHHVMTYLSFSIYPSFRPLTPRILANSCATLGFSVIIKDFATKVFLRFCFIIHSYRSEQNAYPVLPFQQLPVQMCSQKTGNNNSH